METQQQEWRRRAGRRLAADTGGAGSGGGMYTNTGGGAPVNAGHTVASAGKIVRKSAAAMNTSSAHTKPSASAPIPPSRWKELRQSVRIKATMDTVERRMTDARIADLCEEDREKVAKLIRRIVEVPSIDPMESHSVLVVVLRSEHYV